MRRTRTVPARGRPELSQYRRRRAIHRAEPRCTAMASGRRTQLPRDAVDLRSGRPLRAQRPSGMRGGCRRRRACVESPTSKIPPNSIPTRDRQASTDCCPATGTTCAPMVPPGHRPRRLRHRNVRGTAASCCPGRPGDVLRPCKYRRDRLAPDRRSPRQGRTRGLHWMATERRVKHGTAMENRRAWRTHSRKADRPDCSRARRYRVPTFEGGTSRCLPFTWTKTPDQLIPRCQPGKGTSFTRH